MTGARMELRPHHALGGVIAIFAVAALALARLAAGGTASAGGPGGELVHETAPPPAFEIVDAHGRMLARSIERLDLVMSPNAMWQAHTPELMAKRLAEASGDSLNERELLDVMFPDAAEEGFVRVREPLDREQARRLEAWARTGKIGDLEPEGPCDGLWVEARGDVFQLCWDPRIVLSLRERERHGFAKYPQPWTRRLADRIALCLWDTRAVQGDADVHLLDEQRRRVWSLLLPTLHHVVRRGLDPQVAPNIYWTLVEEGVAPHQMSIERTRERVHPAGELDFLGSWSFPTRPEAEGLVARGMGLADASALPSRWRDDFERAVRAVQSERRPRFGLEAGAMQLVSELGLGPGGERGDRFERPTSFAYRRDKPARQRARAYYFDAQPPDEPASVRTTLDLDLERFVGRTLEDVLAGENAALAEAIVIDVASGAVLAVDARSAYPVWGFAPVAHRFTPGSTFKVLVMAAALDAGLVSSDEVIDVGYEPWPLADDNGRVRRRIREAESTKHGLLTAAECLAHSSNRGMTQIGLRLDPGRFHDLLFELGYGVAPSVDLGGSRCGYLPPLPWKRVYTHASLCFGHELSTTLWQHAEALSAVVRGGEWRPLSLFASVESEGLEYELEPEVGVQVFSRAACDEVRAMMQLGAREGTGHSVATPELLPGLIVGTKTGTAEKVGSEVCVHAELSHYADGHACTGACRATISGRPGHNTCYTSSMAIWGQDPRTKRELLVVVVVDEPRGTAKYGSRVAGPTAVKILEEALGRTRFGFVRTAVAVPGFQLGELASENASSVPWSEGEW